MILLLPWLTVPLLGKFSLKRFLPVSFIMTLLVWIVNIIAKQRKWWWWYEKLHPKLPGVTPFMLGPFLVGTLWILRLTFGNIIPYILLNIGFHGFFTFVVEYFLQKYGIASLVRMKKIQLMYVFMVLASILYLLQLIKEKYDRLIER